MKRKRGERIAIYKQPLLLCYSRARFIDKLIKKTMFPNEYQTRPNSHVLVVRWLFCMQRDRPTKGGTFCVRRLDE